MAIQNRQPKRCRLFFIHENGDNHQQRLFIVLARRLIKRHPFARRRKQRQRPASYWTTSTAHGTKYGPEQPRSETSKKKEIGSSTQPSQPHFRETER
jgi:hypothetical protein